MHGAGSLASVVTSYFRTPDFLNLSASSQATYRKVLNPILQKHGHRCVRDVPGDKGHADHHRHGREAPKAWPT
jgi:hypothetical protein